MDNELMPLPTRILFFVGILCIGPLCVGILWWFGVPIQWAAGLGGIPAAIVIGSGIHGFSEWLERYGREQEKKDWKVIPSEEVKLSYMRVKQDQDQQ